MSILARHHEQGCFVSCHADILCTLSCKADAKLKNDTAGACQSDAFVLRFTSAFAYHWDALFSGSTSCGIARDVRFRPVVWPFDRLLTGIITIGVDNPAYLSYRCYSCPGKDNEPQE